jgi:hypothetical protein
MEAELSILTCHQLPDNPYLGSKPGSLRKHLIDSAANRGKGLKGVGRGHGWMFDAGYGLSGDATFLDRAGEAGDLGTMSSLKMELEKWEYTNNMVNEASLLGLLQKPGWQYWSVRGTRRWADATTGNRRRAPASFPGRWSSSGKELPARGRRCISSRWKGGRPPRRGYSPVSPKRRPGTPSSRSPGRGRTGRSISA